MLGRGTPNAGLMICSFSRALPARAMSITSDREAASPMRLRPGRPGRVMRIAITTTVIGVICPQLAVSVSRTMPSASAVSSEILGSSGLEMTPTIKQPNTTASSRFSFRVVPISVSETMGRCYSIAIGCDPVARGIINA